MEELVKKSVNTLRQGIDVATASGAYRNAQDVASLANALTVVESFVKQVYDAAQPTEAESQEEEPQTESVDQEA